MSTCASCRGHATEVMRFGDVALAGAFLKPGEFNGERKYPLSIEFCDECCLMQVPQKIEPAILFEDYFYFSSAIGTMEKHFAHYADEIVRQFKPESVLEIGCNDGVLLAPLAALGVKRLVGVDPAKNVTDKIDIPGVKIVNDFFGRGVVEGQFDVIVANNVLAHVEDLNGTIEAVRDALRPDGAFVFEVNRLDSLISGLQYDWVYHEHRYYFSSLALHVLLSRHGMELFDVKRVGTHAGSARYYAGFKGEHSVSLRVRDQVEREKWHHLDSKERLLDFASDARTHSEALRHFVLEQKACGKRVAGYGACGRTNTMLQFCGLDHTHIDFIIDDAPAKRGFYTPGTHIEIVSRDALKLQPDVLLVFAWSFLQEIQGKCGDYLGQMVVPLPEIYLVQDRMVA